MIYKCKRCNGELVVRIYRNKANQRQQGLYCKECGKYHKFLTNDEVITCYITGYEIINDFGSLADTKIAILEKQKEGRLVETYKIIDEKDRKIQSLEKQIKLMQNCDLAKKIKELELKLDFYRELLKTGSVPID